MLISSRWKMGVRSLMFWVLGYALGTTAGITQAQTVLFSEDFEGLALNDSKSPSEIIRSNVWTNVPPTGWFIDNHQMAGNAVPEFDGWVFVDKQWWIDTAGNQNRSQFTKGTGTIAVADPDEADDLGGLQGTFNSYLSTPSITVDGFKDITLNFDSSWRDENNQKVNIMISYDGGAPVEVLRWESNPASSYFHDDNENETVSIPLPPPSGAGSMVITFGLFDAGNNWWWAIDNLEITGVPALVTMAPTELSVDEGSPTSESYEIVLEQAPTADVLVKATPSDAEIDLGGGAGVVLTLTFTTDNWSTAQTVTVTAIDDDVYEGKDPHQTIIAHTVQSDDQSYDNKILTDVLVNVIDDERICGDWGYLPTDLNLDCSVDLLDFALFAQQWMKTIY